MATKKAPIDFFAMEEPLQKIVNSYGKRNLDIKVHAAHDSVYLTEGWNEALLISFPRSYNTLESLSNVITYYLIGHSAGYDAGKVQMTKNVLGTLGINVANDGTLSL